MAFTIIAIDINNQPRKMWGVLEKLTHMHEPESLLIAGLRDLTPAWSTLSIPKKTAVNIVHPLVEMKNTTTARLTIELIKAVQDARQRQSVLLIGAHAAYREIQEELNHLGHQTEYVYQLARDLAFGDQAKFNELRLLFRDCFMHKKAGRKFVRTDDLFQAIVAEVPEMEDPAFRRKLFGTSKVKGVLKKVGLIGTQGRITGCRLQ